MFRIRCDEFSTAGSAAARLKATEEAADAEDQKDLLGVLRGFGWVVPRVFALICGEKERVANAYYLSR
jgi:hypothetical protein